MAFTQQLGTTTRFPCPSLPCCQSTNCLYAACRKFSLFRASSPASISSLYRIWISSMFPSNTICWNNGFVVIHALTLLVQHLFSDGVGIIMHKPHLHQSGEFRPSSVANCSGCPGGFMFGISPLTKSANTAGWRLSSSTARRRTAPSTSPFINSL